MGRTERIAILSKKEKDLLKNEGMKTELLRERENLMSKYENLSEASAKKKKRIKEINADLKTISTRLAQLTGELEHRLHELPDDLTLIMKSKALRPLIVIRGQYFDDISLLWSQIHKMQFGHDYSTWRIVSLTKPVSAMDEPGQVTKRRVTLYWLDKNAEPGITIEDIFRPSYAMRGVKEKIWFKRTIRIVDENKEVYERKRYDNKQILKRALELEKNGLRIIPTEEGKAVDIYEIERRIISAGSDDIGRRSITVSPYAAKQFLATPDDEKQRAFEDLERRFGEKMIHKQPEENSPSEPLVSCPNCKNPMRIAMAELHPRWLMGCPKCYTTKEFDISKKDKV